MRTHNFGSIVLTGMMVLSPMVAGDSAAPLILAEKPKSEKLAAWANKYKYINGSSLWDSATKNVIPSELAGTPGKLAKVMKYIGYDKGPEKFRYQFDNSTCVIIPLSDKFDILLFGGRIGKVNDIFVSKAMLLPRREGDKLRESIEKMFD